MSKETRALVEPIEIGKLVITEFVIDHRPKGKYWRVAQQPLAVDASSDGSDEVTVHITNGQSEIALMQAMTGQPLEVIDELGVEDFDYIFGAAVKMLGNFNKAKHLPKMEGSNETPVAEPQAKLDA